MRHAHSELITFSMNQLSVESLDAIPRCRAQLMAGVEVVRWPRMHIFVVLDAVWKLSWCLRAISGKTKKRGDDVSGQNMSLKRMKIP